MLTETARKLREKFYGMITRLPLRKHISKVTCNCFKAILNILNILSDAPDSRVLECAKEANANLYLASQRTNTFLI